MPNLTPSPNAPSFEPITLEEAKAWLRIGHAHDDEQIQTLIQVARARIESETETIVPYQIFDLRFDTWPEDLLRDGRLLFPISPVQSIFYVFAPGESGEFITEAFHMESEEDGDFLVFDRSYDPDIVSRVTRFVVSFSAGLATSREALPQPLRYATRLILQDAWRTRLGEHDESLRADIDRVLQPWRRIRL